MTFDQIALVILLALLFGAFALDRVRLEVAAILGLLAAFALGLVPAESVFSGLAHPAVITVAEILILVGALQASHVLDRTAAMLTKRIGSRALLLLVLCSIGGTVSIFMNNIGALALMIPLASAVSDRSKIPLGELLMPISFATLLGGMGSLIGTPANLIVSDVLEDETGKGFGFFDISWVGLPTLVVGLIAIVLFVPRLLPKSPVPALGLNPEERETGSMILEAFVPPRSALAGRYVPAAEAELGGHIESVRRGEAFVFGRRESIRLEPGDIVLVDAPRAALNEALRAQALMTAPSRSQTPEVQGSAVVVPESVIRGSRISTLEGFDELGVRVLAITSPRKRLEGRFSDLQLAVGDVLHLAGSEAALGAAIREHGLLGLKAEEEKFPTRAALPPLLGFFGAVALAATGVLRPELAFGAAITTLVAFRYLDLVAAIRRLNWPILLMLAAMIPLGMAVETTGTAELVAQSFLGIAPQAGPLFVLFAILLTAVVITPFVNNASTAIILAPIAFEISSGSGLSPEIALLAVAVGVSLDFLTPFGHHNNTIVMGIGGYKFSDFPKAGFPVLVAAFLTAFIALAAMKPAF